MKTKDRISNDNKKSALIPIEKNIIRRYFYFGSISAIILLSILLSSIYIKTLNKEHSNKIKQLSESIIDEKKRFLRNAVERTISLIKSERSIARKENSSKDMTDKQIEAIAIKRIKDKIRNLHLIDHGYIWVNKIVNYNGGDKYAIREVHPNLPNTEGMWLSTRTKDIKGNLPYLTELEGIKKNGELYFEYYFKKMNSDKIAHKLSFAKLYKPYDWVVATGVYLDDVDKLIANETKKMQKDHDTYKFYTFLASLFVIIIAIIIIIIFEKLISRLITSYETKINDYTQELKEYQEHLEKSNSILNESQKIAHFGSWEFDLIENSLEWSDEVYNIFGLKPQSIKATYEEFLKFIHPDDREMVNRSYQESIKQKSDYQMRHRVVRADKSIAYVNEIGHHDFDEKGNVVRTIGTMHDITKLVQYEMELERIKNELESIVKNIPDILFRSKYDSDRTMLFVNDAIESITGYKAVDFINNKLNYSKIIHVDDRDTVNENINSAIKDNKKYLIEYRIFNSFGDIVWVRESGKKTVEENGVEYLEGIIIDITAQKKMFEKLQKFIDIQDNIIILTDGFTVKFANKKFLDFFGLNNIEEFIERNNCICKQFIENEDFFHLGKVLPKEKHWVESLLNLSGRERVVSIKDKKGRIHAFSVAISVYDPTTYAVNFNDISETMVEKLQLKKRVMHDQLTGAYNRFYFDTTVENLIEHNRSDGYNTGFIMLDIDFFKKVNDTYGHNVGDSVLITLSNLIRRFTRENDKLIRWGGEEFILIMPANSIDDVYKEAEHLRSAVQDYKFANVPQVTCSFGAVLYNENDTMEATIEAVDKKLYKAKESGRNRVVI